MKRIIPVFIATTLILTACAQQKKATDSTAASNNNETAVVTTTAKAAKINIATEENKRGAIEQIAMERTACFGTCPVYRIEVNKDGSLIYIGRHYVDHEGTYRNKVSTSKVDELFKQFREYRIDTCSEEYNSLIQDVPGVYYYITYENSNDQQEIRNAHFGPEFLKRLSFEVDSFAKVDNSWDKIDDTIEE